LYNTQEEGEWNTEAGSGMQMTVAFRTLICEDTKRPAHGGFRNRQLIVILRSL
jgi:hypothetical protein